MGTSITFAHGPGSIYIYMHQYMLSLQLSVACYRILSPSDRLDIWLFQRDHTCFIHVAVGPASVPNEEVHVITHRSTATTPGTS